MRLILDLRYVNMHVFKDNIIFDDWKIMQDFLEPTDLLFKFGISQGYHHIDIDEQHQKYLGFSWTIKGQTRDFVFTVLAFGLTSAPFLFTLRSQIKKSDPPALIRTPPPPPPPPPFINFIYFLLRKFFIFSKL